MRHNIKTSIKKNSTSEDISVIDNNIIEFPLFISSLKDIIEIGQLEKCVNDNRIINRVIEVIKADYKRTTNPENYKNIPVVYRQWTDSKGLERQLLVTHAIPDMTTMDVWNALLGLYSKNMSPINFNTNKHTYELEFTLYELAKFMNKSIGGTTFHKLIKDISRLSSAKYYHFAHRVVCNKQNTQYHKSKNQLISLIDRYQFNSEKRVKGKKVVSKCTVQFNKLIIDNIIYQYIKYIDPEEYFALPSRGLTRRLYVYLKGNSYQSSGTKHTYIKRSFQVLQNKIPISERQSSKVKERLRVPLTNLIKNGMITDYFYGDEDIINEKEKCIYFIFKGKKDDVIKNLRKKYEEKQLQLQIALDDVKEENKFQMKIPENLDKTLEDIGFNKNVVKQLDKWHIIKYIVWLQQQQFKSKGTSGTIKICINGKY